MIIQDKMIVKSQKEIAKNIFEMTLSGKLVMKLRPGQFVHIRVSDSYEMLLEDPFQLHPLIKR